MKKFKKMSISELIFYMSIPDTNIVEKDDIEKIVYTILKKEHKLESEEISEFIKREQAIIEKRGYDLDSYIFSSNMSLDSVLELVLSNKKIEIDSEIKHYETLMFSELVSISVIMDSIQDKYFKEAIKLNKEKESLVKKEELVVKDIMKTFENRKDLIMNIDDTVSGLKDLESKYEAMGDYFKSLSIGLNFKLKTILKRELSVIYKSVGYAREYYNFDKYTKNIFNDFEIKYKNIKVETFENDLELLKRLNVDDLSFERIIEQRSTTQDFRSRVYYNLLTN